MNFIKRFRNDNYTTISNTFLRDIRLSSKAKGIMAIIMGLPDDWDFTINGIVAIVKEGERAVRGAINELKEYGYCHCEAIRVNNKIAHWRYYFDGDGMVKEKLLCCFVHVENEEVQNVHVQNEAQINTYIINSTLPNNSKSTPKENKDVINVLSDDKDKEVTPEFDELFEVFWNNYGKKVEKKKTRAVWDKLSKVNRQRAIDAIQAYKQSREFKTKYMKDPVRYLRDHVWEDDFSTYNKNTFYEPCQDDSDEERRFKEWMRRDHPGVEQTRCPLSYEDFMMLKDKYSIDEVCVQLDYIDANIPRFRDKDIREEIDYFLRRQNERAAV